MIINLIITDLCFSYVIVSLIGLKEKKNLFLLMFCDNQFKNYSRVYTLSQLSHILKKIVHSTCMSCTFWFLYVAKFYTGQKAHGLEAEEQTDISSA